ncbi:MAG TPA: cobalt transporter CbiM, partial [Armatimonadota bacterium]|nr:cobalt transporter CbiM [Armatimonadota bacterium]
MHIPDGYVGPQTYGIAYAIMLPVWAAASKVLRKNLSRKQIPILALGAAFCFVVMFLNVPVMGRMTAHPVGAGLVAIISGPWAACIAISAALAIQAVPFGDGGITTFGANCLNLAFIMPFISWGVFKLIIGSQPSQRRLWIASAVAGYIGIVAASAAVAMEIGLQPHIAGQGMYLPYSIGTSLKVMLIPHILIVGPIEAIITASAVTYVYRTESWRFTQHEPGVAGSVVKRLAVVAIILLLLTPLGVLLPQWFGAGAAWAEWGTEELHQMFGYVPQGIAKGIDFWKAPIPDYALPGNEATPVTILIIGLIGTTATLALGLGIGKLIFRKGEK